MAVASTLKATLREVDMVARYGGEEFCVVLPEMNLDKAKRFAETVRGLVEEHVFVFEGNQLRMTCSLGVAVVQESMAKPEDLVALADDNLYRAKNEGRNRVVG